MIYEDLKSKKVLVTGSSSGIGVNGDLYMKAQKTILKLPQEIKGR